MDKIWLPSLLAFCIGTGAFFAAGADALPMIRYERAADEVKFTSTGAAAELPDPDKTAVAGVAPDSLAARLALDGRRFRWVPGENTVSALGEAAVSDAAISPDGSVLAVLETLGAPSGPFGTRIVLINTASGAVLRVAETASAQRFIRVLFLPSDRLLLLEKSQRECGRNALHFFNLSNFTWDGVPPLCLPESVSDLVSGPDGTIYAQSAESGKLWMIRDGAAQLFETGTPGGKLLLSNDAELLYVAGAGVLKRFRFRNGEWFPERPRRLPDRNRTDFLLPGKDGGVIAGTTGKPALVCFADAELAPLELEGECGAAAAVDVDGGRLFLALERKSSLGFFNIPSARSPYQVLAVNTMKPKHRGEITRMFLLAAEPLTLLAFDSRANLYRLGENKKRRIQKEMLLSPFGD